MNLNFEFDKVPDDLIEGQIRAAMAQAGVVPHGGVDSLPLVRDGKIHRFRIEGASSGSKDGAYCFYNDGGPAAGWFSNWRQGEAIKWCFDYTALKDGAYHALYEGSLSPEWKKAAKAQEAERKKKEEAERVKALEDARIRFEAAPECPKDHDYFVRKGVAVPDGLKTDSGGNALLPLYDGRGRLQGIQRIPAAAGEAKKHWPGLSYSGAFFTLGRDIETGPILLCEGIATAASVFQCLESRYMTVCATSAGNLPKVAAVLNNVYKGRSIIVMADDDAKTATESYSTGRKKENTGMKKAAECLRAKTAAGVVPPPFDRAEDKDGMSLSDWNDYHVAHGEQATAEALARELEAALQRRGNSTDQDEAGKSVKVVAINCAELWRAEFPPMKWAVDGILPAGLSILAGSPKVGKSFLALHIALGIALGGQVLETVNVAQGQVLYLSLEDPKRRLQARVKLALDEYSEGLSNLDFVIESPRQDAGGLDYIRQWLEAHNGARLVIVDTLQKFRPVKKRGEDSYQSDYDAVAGLKKLADEFQVAFLLIHHTRKAQPEDGDFLQLVSGTQGLSGAADSTLVMTRQRNSPVCVLSITGRDVEEAELALSRDDRGGYKLEGNSGRYFASEQSKVILEYLEEHGEAKPKDIADALDMRQGTVRGTLSRLEDKELVVKKGRGVYALAIPKEEQEHLRRIVEAKCKIDEAAEG